MLILNLADITIQLGKIMYVKALCKLKRIDKRSGRLFIAPVPIALG